MTIGVDVTGRGDYNTYIIRQENKAWIESWNRSNDTMTNVSEVIRIIDNIPIQTWKASKYNSKFLWSYDALLQHPAPEPGIRWL